MINIRDISIKTKTIRDGLAFSARARDGHADAQPNQLRRFIEKVMDMKIVSDTCP